MPFICIRRQRASPLQTARDVITNASLSHADRYQTLADALVEIKKVGHRRALFQLCVDHGYFEGAHLIASGLNAEDMKHQDDEHDRGQISAFVESHRFTETQIVTILRLLLVKWSSLNVVCRDITDADKHCFVVFYTPFESWHYSTEHEEHIGSKVHLGQSIIRRNLPNALRLIIPTLQLFKTGIRLALIEAIGSDVRACCDVFVDADLDARSMDFAVFLSAFYGRFDLLKRLWNRLSTKHRQRLCASMRADCASLPGFCWISDMDENKMRLLEAAVRRNHPLCVDFLIKNNALAHHDPLVDTSESQRDSQHSLIRHCVDSNFVDCAKLLLSQCTEYKVHDEILRQLIKNGVVHSGLISLTVVSMTNLTNRLAANGASPFYENGFQLYLANLVTRCAEDGSHAALLALLSTIGADFLNEDIFEYMVKASLHQLVNQGTTGLAVEVIKYIALMMPMKEINLIPTFKHCVLRSENVELIEFFLSLNNTKILDAAHQLKPQVKNDEIKKLLEQAEFKVKIEAKVKVEAQPRKKW